MKTIRILIFSACFLTAMLFASLTATSQVGIGTANPDASAVLDLSSTTAGLLVPRITQTERDAILNPALGLMIFLNDDGCFYYFNGSAWLKITNNLNASDVWIDANNNMLSRNSANQGLGGAFSVILGRDAFNDNYGNSNYVNAIGYEAARFNSTPGDAFVNALGFKAAYSNNGSDVNAIGRGSAYHSTGTYVDAIGALAAYNNTGHHLIAMGHGSAYNNQGNDDVAIGTNAASNNIGSNVIAFGNGSAFNCKGDENIAIGTYALADHTLGGTYVNALGYEAARFDSSTGNGNVNAIGTHAAYRNKGGCVNAIGLGSAYYNTHNYVNVIGVYFTDAPQNEATILTGDLFLKDPEDSYGYTTGNKLTFNNGNVVESTAADVLQIKDVLRLKPRSTEPSPAVKGMMYFDDGTNKLRVYDGTAWTDCN